MPERSELVVSREVPGRHPVVALGRPGLHFPSQSEVDGQLRGRAPVVLRVHREVFLCERGLDVGAGADPPDPAPEQHGRGVHAALRVRRHERRDAAAGGRVLEVVVAAGMRERRRHRDGCLLEVPVIGQQTAILHAALVDPPAAHFRDAAGHAVVGLELTLGSEGAPRQRRPVAATAVAAGVAVWIDNRRRTRQRHDVLDVGRDAEARCSR